jgi:molybdenum ABC transporter molybdate-binding protein
MNRSPRILKGIAALIGIGLVLAFTWPRDEPRSGAKSGEHLLLYCAAGLRDPLQTIISDYQRTYAVTIAVQYGGSGTLLSSLKVSQRGDLYLAADARHMDLAVDGGLARETIPIARQHLVLATRAGNPKAIHQLKDLTRSDVRVAYANPEVASAGKTIQNIMEKLNLWEVAKRQAAVFKPTVNDVMNDVVLGSVDVGVVWSPLVALYPGLEAIHTQELDAHSEQIRIGVLTSSTHRQQALHFARYVSASDRGLKVFQRSGYLIERGDQWVEAPMTAGFRELAP